MPRRRLVRRRRRARWDMQTFRLCEQSLELTDGFDRSCASPAITATKVLALSSGTSFGLEAAGSARAILFGGGHLRVRINTAVVNHSDCPCSHGVHMVNALVVLPLLEDDATPAYLPNLTTTRTFDSVIAASNADKDEDILWWHDYQLDVMNTACSTGGIPCGLRLDGDTCTEDWTKGIGSNLEANASAMYGRFELDHKVRVKRRLKERQALFFITEWFSGLGNNFGDCPTWPYRRNVYLRYAVRPSR